MELVLELELVPVEEVVLVPALAQEQEPVLEELVPARDSLP